LSSLRSDAGGEEVVVYCQDLSGEELPSEADQLEAGRKARLEAITEGKQPPPVIVRVSALSPEERAERLRQRREYAERKAVQVMIPEEPDPIPATAGPESPAPVEVSSGPAVAQFKEKPRESVTSYFNRHGWPTWRF
jgi:hypothetical protein